MRSATVLHQPLIEPNDVKWRLAGQRAATVLNCAAQADIVRGEVGSRKRQSSRSHRARLHAIPEMFQQLHPAIMNKTG